MFIRSTLCLVCCLSAYVACSPSKETDSPAGDSGNSDTGIETIDKADGAADDSGGHVASDSGVDASDDASAERSATIGAAGGKLESSDGAFALTVPVDVIKKDGTVKAKPGAADGATPLASSVIDVTLIDENGNTVSQLDNDVEICLRPTPGADTSTSCLGYLNDKNTWVCEDECLSGNDKGQLCGSTNHFTNFALLLTGGSGSSDKCRDDLVYFTGGKVVSTDKLATATIPDGAFDKTTRVTVRTESTKDPIVGSGVYNFTPSTTFKKPVTLCITPNVGAATKEGCLGYFDDNTKKWTCEDKCLKSSGGQLCGNTTHFTPFAILLSGGGTACP